MKEFLLTLFGALDSIDPKAIIDGGALLLLTLVLYYIGRFVIKLFEKIADRIVVAFEQISKSMVDLNDTLSKIQTSNAEHFGRDDAVQSQIANQLRDIETRLEVGFSKLETLVLHHEQLSRTGTDSRS
jgi:Mg2+ and Co2+ transporter CorA